jgi:hypothetical protein
MANDRREGPVKDAGPVPRDLPDQQTDADRDPWEVPVEEADATTGEDVPGTGRDVPDTDEAGTGPSGAPRSASAHPEQPVPDEPTG